jgi:dodecin
MIEDWRLAAKRNRRKAIVSENPISKRLMWGRAVMSMTYPPPMPPPGPAPLARCVPLRTPLQTGGEQTLPIRQQVFAAPGIARLVQGVQMAPVARRTDRASTRSKRSTFGTNRGLKRCCEERVCKRKTAMPDHVYRIIEVAGSSEKSLEDAIQNAVGRASRTLRQVGWFEVIQTRGHVENSKVAHFQVVLKVGFTLEGD